MEYKRSAHPGNKFKITNISKDADAVITTQGSHNLVTGTKPVYANVLPNDFTNLFNGEATNNIVVTGDNTFTTGVNASAIADNYTSGTLTVDTDANNLKIKRSKAAFNLLFWGEVMKVMSVNNDNVTITYI